MALHLVLIGPPGSGKGTQAVRLARRYGVPHISTGDILRQAVRDDTPLGREVAATIAGGVLVSDELISQPGLDRLSRGRTRRADSCSTAFRARSRRRECSTSVQRDLIVVHIAVPDEEIVKRLSTRRICRSCGLTQSVSDGRGRNRGLPVLRRHAVRREDDDPDTVRKRLATYAALAGPLVDFYAGRGPAMFSSTAVKAPDKVTAERAAALDARR